MTEAPLDIDRLRQWIGRTETATDTVFARLVAGYVAVLDDLKPDQEAGEAAPLAIHWCFHVGDVVTRQSTVRDVVLKTGRSGALCFVTVDHAFNGPLGLVLNERRDIVYRAPCNPNAPAPAIPQVPKPRWSYSAMADPVLLFHYSAITCNGHRIHYDRNHAIKTEGYAVLVVHGPLLATMMLEYAARLRGAPPQRFDYRAISPLIDGAAFTVNAAERDDGLHLWTAADDGRLCMEAQASWK